MKQSPNKKIDAAGLRQAITTLAVAAGIAGWAVLARSEGATAVVNPVAQVAVTQAAGLTAGRMVPVSAAQAPAPRLRVVTAAPAPITSTRSSR